MDGLFDRKVLNWDALTVTDLIASVRRATAAFSVVRNSGFLQEDGQERQQSMLLQQICFKFSDNKLYTFLQKMYWWFSGVLSHTDLRD